MSEQTTNNTPARYVNGALKFSIILDADGTLTNNIGATEDWALQIQKIIDTIVAGEDEEVNGITEDGRRYADLTRTLAKLADNSSSVAELVSAAYAYGRALQRAESGGGGFMEMLAAMAAAEKE